MKKTHDCQLREHPAHTIRRLRALGVWPDADRLLRSVKQRSRNRFAKLGPMTAECHLEMNAAAWNALHDRWPPPRNTQALRSLADYLRGTRGALRSDTDRTDPLPPLSAAAERRFDEIGEETDYQRDLDWIYHHINDNPPDPLICPTRGCWNMYLKARKDQDTFYKQLGQVINKSVSKKVDTEVQHTPLEKMAREAMKKMLEDARERCLAQKQT